MANMSLQVVLAATAFLVQMQAGGVSAAANNFPLSTDSQRAQRDASAKVSVSVYYEALCRDSANLFTTQLHPTLQKAGLADRLELTLIPYGRANHTKLADGTETIECHHGKKECEGNKVHDCALKHIASKQGSFDFVTCLFEIIDEEKQDMDAEFSLGKCADTISTDEKNAIITCATGSEGDEELAAMGAKTDLLDPKITFCPWIVYNGVYNQAVEDESRENFQKVLCEHIPSPKPDECGSAGSAIAPAVSIAVLLSSITVTLF